jgi:hypothetical protein
MRTLLIFLRGLGRNHQPMLRAYYRPFTVAFGLIALFAIFYLARWMDTHPR